jgi:fucose 4-O-acetylase-like acetyltransferase
MNTGAGRMTFLYTGIKKTAGEYMKNYCDEQGRYYYFDNLKFLLIMLVVIGHFVDPFRKIEPAYSSLYFFIYLFHMPLFVFTTGIFAKTMFEGGGAGGHMMPRGRFCTEKIISFFILYFGLSFAIFLIEHFLTGKDVTYSLLTNSNASWYLLACVLWYTALPLFCEMKPRIVIPLICLISVFAGYTSEIGDFLMLSRVLYFAPFFFLGYFLNADDVIRRISVRPQVRALAAALLICACALCFVFSDVLLPFRGLLTARNSYEFLSSPELGGLYRIGLYLVSALLCVAFMLIVPKGRAFFTKLGANTLQVYIWHLIILRLLGAVHFVPLIATASESFSAIRLIPLLLAIAVTFLFSLNPPFGIVIRRLLGVKYRFLFRDVPKRD